MTSHRVPRYSKPIPASRLPGPGDPWHVRAIDSMRAAAERERHDHMIKIGMVLGALALAVFIAATAAA